MVGGSMFILADETGSKEVSNPAKIPQLRRVQSTNLKLFISETGFWSKDDQAEWRKRGQREGGGETPPHPSPPPAVPTPTLLGVYDYHQCGN